MRKLYAVIILFASVLCAYAQSNIAGYEYWFNQDYANKITTMVTSTSQLTINQSLPATELFPGLNTLNFRSFDESGIYSSIVSHYFYKTNLPETNPTPEIAAYTYWIDEDYSNAVIVNTPLQKQLNINELISMSDIDNGAHNLNIRFKDNAGLWSSVVSQMFYKTPEQIVDQNLITEYRYWIDNDFAGAKRFSITPNQQINLIDSLDLSMIPKGGYQINFQFRDSLGRWSIVLTDSIEKKSLPIADFSYSTLQYCDSTVIAFTDKSIDGNKYLWDFGNGITSDLTNPIHTYYIPDTYQVRLEVSDTVLGQSNSKLVPVVIHSLHNSSTINETACDFYIAPDGQIHTTTGMKTAIIPNLMGCDSSITINLTIDKIDVSVTQDGVTLTANATADLYQWLDCNNGNSTIIEETSRSFTPTQNGAYAVKITHNNCTDTSACFAITTVGVLENTFSNDITVYPNPTNGIVTIDLGETLPEFRVQINDLHGKLIRQTTYKNTRVFELNLNIESGIYLMTINSDNKKATIRLIKN